MRRSIRSTIIALAIAATLAACAERGEDSEGESVQAEDETIAESVSNVERAEEEALPPLPPKRLMVERFVARVRAEPKKSSHRLGYLRAGALHMATTGRPLGHEGCEKGWFELEGGGFVCSDAEVTPFDGSKLPSLRPRQPDLEAPLPYPYARLKRRAPLYRRLPTLEEAQEIEGYALPKEPAPERDAASVDAGASPDADGGAAPDANAASSADAGAAEDSGPPTLDDLLGDRGSIVQRTGIRGFTLSVDRSYERYGRTYYRTFGNGFIGAEHLVFVEGSDFEGVELDEERSLPVAFFARRRGRAMAYEMRESGRLRPARREALRTHDSIRVIREERVGERDFVVSEDERYYRERDLVVIRRSERPLDVAEDEKWLDVDLTQQTLVAYVGDSPVFATLVSTGRIRREGDPERDHRTPVGVFRVRAKHLTHTMDGDSAVDGPYSIDDVPYVQYFHGAYALHTAFWHDRFGTPRSHGCVNLAPEDAKRIFAFTEPLPREGWHGTYPAEDEEGTVIRVRGETPRG